MGEYLVASSHPCNTSESMVEDKVVDGSTLAKVFCSYVIRHAKDVRSLETNLPHISMLCSARMFRGRNHFGFASLI